MDKILPAAALRRGTLPHYRRTRRGALLPLPHVPAGAWRTGHRLADRAARRLRGDGGQPRRLPFFGQGVPAFLRRVRHAADLARGRQPAARRCQHRHSRQSRGRSSRRCTFGPRARSAGSRSPTTCRAIRQTSGPGRGSVTGGELAAARQSDVGLSAISGRQHLYCGRCQMRRLPSQLAPAIAAARSTGAGADASSGCSRHAGGRTPRRYRRRVLLVLRAIVLALASVLGLGLFLRLYRRRLCHLRLGQRRSLYQRPNRQREYRRQSDGEERRIAGDDRSDPVSAGAQRKAGEKGRGRGAARGRPRRHRRGAGAARRGGGQGAAGERQSAPRDASRSSRLRLPPGARDRDSARSRKQRRLWPMPKPPSLRHSRCWLCIRRRSRRSPPRLPICNGSSIRQSCWRRPTERLPTHLAGRRPSGGEQAAASVWSTRMPGGSYANYKESVIRHMTSRPYRLGLARHLPVACSSRDDPGHRARHQPRADRAQAAALCRADDRLDPSGAALSGDVGIAGSRARTSSCIWAPTHAR